MCLVEVESRFRGENPTVTIQTHILYVARYAATLLLVAACAEQSPHAASPQNGEERRLKSEEVQSVLSAANPRVVEQCWRPALDAHGKDAHSAGMKLMAHFIIEPSGHVKDVKVDDAPAPFTELSSCVHGIVEKLEFPASSLPTTVNAPFVLEMNETTTETPASKS